MKIMYQESIAVCTSHSYTYAMIKVVTIKMVILQIINRVVIRGCGYSPMQVVQNDVVDMDVRERNVAPESFRQSSVMVPAVGYPNIDVLDGDIFEFQIV